jgi:hypothetical protein
VYADPREEEKRREEGKENVKREGCVSIFVKSFKVVDVCRVEIIKRW